MNVTCSVATVVEFDSVAGEIDFYTQMTCLQGFFEFVQGSLGES